MAQKTWDLPRDLLAQSIQVMRPYGAIGHEGLALWFGDDRGDAVEITHLIVPHGPGLVTHPLHLSLSLRAIARLTGLSGRLDRYWAGQIHSHPGVDVRLSEVDKRMGVLVQDYLSVVCPHYAQQPVTDLRECGIHIFDRGAYRQLAPAEVGARIHVSERTVEVVPVEVPA
ncbi:MAG TPA: hypothetical protein VE934_02300 [Polaromonas sp.]|uniref:hypothetical protein n=1 Tax=Polaromonas sp. TaxID=1869339 RepID=UPI002D36D9A9|nr:hypothetical protein [Polaromonas sp.]HYW55765.1 hypothetical protein [Polaromonas sp.]